MIETTEKTVTTRDRIVETGLRLFSKMGYLGATTKEIAREAGIAEVTLFRHFPSKEKLFEEVLNTYSFLPALKGLMPEVAQMGYEEALRLIAGRFLEVLDLRRDLIQILHAEAARYPEKVYTIYNSFIDEILLILGSYFRDLQEKGTLRAFDAETAARLFFGMFFSYFTSQEFMMRKKYRPTDPVKIVRAYVSIFVRGTVVQAR